MGDMADMMRDGTLCADCGEVFADMLPTREEEKRARRENRLPVSNAAPPGRQRLCKECKRGRKKAAVADPLTARQRFDAAEDLRRVARMRRPLGGFLTVAVNHFFRTTPQRTFYEMVDDERRLLMLLLAEAIEQGDLP